MCEVYIKHNLNSIQLIFIKLLRKLRNINDHIFEPRTAPSKNSILFIKRDNEKMPNSYLRSFGWKSVASASFYFFEVFEILKELLTIENPTSIRQMKSYFFSTNGVEIWLCQALIPYTLHTSIPTFDGEINKRFLRMTGPFGYILKRKTCLRETLEL